MGLIQNPLGSMKGQIKKMEKIVSEWMPLVTCNYIPSSLIYQGFWCTLWPSLRYALPCLSLTKTEADRILLPVYKHLLPKIHTVRTLPIAYRYGTIKYFGLNLPNLHHEQTIAKLDVLMMHHMTPTLTQKHLLHSWEHLQVEAGTGSHFLSTSYQTFGKYCTKCWLSSLWEDISLLPISIKVNNMTLPSLLRENDIPIMEYVISHYNCTTSELKAINRVRLHHKCYSLAHIVSGRGTQFCLLSPAFRSSILSSITFPKTIPIPQDY